MSLPWSNSVRLRISPEGVEATLERAWPRRAQIASVTRAGTAFDPNRLADGVAGPADGSKAELIDLALLELEASASIRGARLHAVLDDALVHVDVAEGDFAGMSEHQLGVLAQACVAEILGDAAERKEVRWSVQPDEKHLAICAIERGDLTLLGDAAKLRGMTLAHVHTQFASCWNVHARPQHAAQMVFVVASGLQAVVACVVERSICALSTGPWLDHEPTAGAPSVLDERVDRLLACLGVDAASMDAFVAVLQKGSTSSLSGRWAVVEPQEVAT